VKPLDGQVAVVAGASGGVGAAIALALAGAGATLCLVGRRRDPLDALARRAAALPGRALVQTADLTVDEEIDALRAGVERELGRVDVLVHAAGVIALGPHASGAVDDLDRQYRTNVRAPYALTQALLPALTRQQGQVIFLNSTLGFETRPGTGQYASSKHGLRALADALRQEVNADGVRVTTIYLGRTASAMQAGVMAQEGRPYRPERLIQPDDVAAMVLAAVLLPRTAEVTEIRIRPMSPP
jgi:NADP-dependent 3-hydroxy acid dehydrogenase YdfG